MQSVVHRLPPQLRHWVSARSLRPGSSAWLLPQFEGVQVRAGRRTIAATPNGNKITLQFDQGAGEYDHVLLATGYKIDLSRLGILAPDLLRDIKLFDGAPVLTKGFEASVPGLHFVGGSAVWSYGPLIRLICGAGYAARTVTRSVLGKRSCQVETRRKTSNSIAAAWRRA